MPDDVCVDACRCLAFDGRLTGGPTGRVGRARFVRAENDLCRCGTLRGGRVEPDLIIWGMTANGRPFRPSDWSERLCGLTAALGPDKRLQYSPWLLPIVAGGIRAVVVDRQLAELEPRLYHFLLGFARDNELQIAWVPGARASPHDLVPPPLKPPSPEPREPV